MLKKKGGVKGFLNNVQKTALLVADGFPNLKSDKKYYSTWHDILSFPPLRRDNYSA